MRTITLFGFLLLAGFLAAPVAAATAPNSGASLRIATFNTHLLSPAFKKELTDSEHADADAHAVAQAILDAPEDPDVIALNEVWDEDAKDILENTLNTKYPYYVKKLEGGSGGDLFSSCPLTVGLSTPEDSGLMLFSKLPFVKFWLRPPLLPQTRAFHSFTLCKGIDCCASKGVGLVVLSNTYTDRTYVVAFGHLQDESELIRAEQMAEVNEFVKGILDLNSPQGISLGRSEVFILGDLNIAGVNPPDEKPMQWIAPASEWASFFWHNKSSPYYYPFYDTWAWTTSPFDSGYTSPGGHERLDYIIHDRSTNGPVYCMQHLSRIMRGKSNADHTAVMADANKAAAYCNPRLARRPEKEPGFAWDKLLVGNLQYPGSMEWYRFDQKGTYRIGIPSTLLSQGVRAAVYHGSDLSTPVGVYEKEVKAVVCGTDPLQFCTVETYRIPEAPFYVRVSNPGNRTWYGYTKLYVHRNTCTSLDEACALGPNEPGFDPTPTTTQPVNAADIFWFRLHTDKAWSGKAQNLEVHVKNDSGDVLQLRLLDTGGTTVLNKTSPTWVLSPQITRDEIGNRRLYVTVGRKSYTQSHFEVGWRTNLTWLAGMVIPSGQPFRLYCGDETGSDWAGSDEIDMYVSVDGLTYYTAHFGDVDSDDIYTLEGSLVPVAYLDSVKLWLSENDDDSKEPSNVGVISPLPPTENKALVQEIGLFPGDGDYFFYYNLSRTLNQ